MSARAATKELVARYGYVLIPPFDDRTVSAGQGTTSEAKVLVLVVLTPSAIRSG
jgi:hypothetical protein